MKLCDAKKQSMIYRDIKETYFTKENFEDFEVFHLVFLQ